MGFIIAAAIILLIMFFRVGVRVLSDESLSVGIDLGLFKIPLYPAKDKKIKLKRFRIKAFRKDLAKQEAKRRKKAEKKLSKKKNKAAADEDVHSEDIQRKKRDITELVGTVTDIAGVFIRRFGKYLRIKIRKLVIVVATPDAASTAVMYGAVCGAVQCFLELVDSNLDVKCPKSSQVEVIPDFTSERSGALVDVTFSFRVWQLFDILIRTAVSYLKRNH